MTTIGLQGAWRPETPPEAAGRRPNDEDHARALEVFQRLKPEFERGFTDMFVTIDGLSGTHAVGPTRIASVEAFKARFGEAVTITFHIGGTG